MTAMQAQVLSERTIRPTQSRHHQQSWEQPTSRQNLPYRPQNRLGMTHAKRAPKRSRMAALSESNRGHNHRQRRLLRPKVTMPKFRRWHWPMSNLTLVKRLKKAPPFLRQCFRLRNRKMSLIQNGRSLILTAQHRHDAGPLAMLNLLIEFIQGRVEHTNSQPTTPRPVQRKATWPHCFDGASKLRLQLLQFIRDQFRSVETIGQKSGIVVHRELDSCPCR